METGRFLISLDVFVETECDGARGTSLNLTHGLFSLFSAFKLCAVQGFANAYTLLKNSHYTEPSCYNIQFWIPSLRTSCQAVTEMV